MVSELTDLPAVLSALALGLVQLQNQLDERALASEKRWEEDAIPPSAFNLADVTLQLPVGCACATRAQHDVVLRVRPALLPHARLSTTIRYLSCPPHVANAMR